MRNSGDLKVDDSLGREELRLGRTPLRQQLADTIDWLRESGLLTTESAISA